MKKSINFSAGLVIAILVMAASCQAQQPAPHVKPTSFFSKNADVIFLSAVLGDTPDVNKGLNIKKIESSDGFSFVVLNHTNETIVFEDQGFGMRLFSFDNPSAEWQNLSLEFRYEKILTTIPANTESWDIEVQNTGTLFESDLAKLKFEKIRLLISGHGDKSNTYYFAYLDFINSTYHDKIQK